MLLWLLSSLSPLFPPWFLLPSGITPTEHNLLLPVPGLIFLRRQQHLTFTQPSQCPSHSIAYALWNVLTYLILPMNFWLIPITQLRDWKHKAVRDMHGRGSAEIWSETGKPHNPDEKYCKDASFCASLLFRTWPPYLKYLLSHSGYSLAHHLIIIMFIYILY